MVYAKYIGRAGALAVALSIGIGLAATPWAASAKPSDSGSTASSDSPADGTSSPSASESSNRTQPDITKQPTGTGGGCSSACTAGGQSVYGFLAPGTGGVNSDGKAQGFYVKFEADENAPVPGATVRNSGNSFAGHLSVSEPFQGTSSGAVPPNNGGGGHTTGFFGDCSGRGCG
jgi:hypothetical protein